MTKRTKAHEIGDQAILYLISEFGKQGWTSEEVSRDYGEDLYVRIFEDGDATNKFFHVQSKATSNLERYQKEGGEFSFPFTVNHIRSWLSFRHPVLVTLFDAKAGVAYWLDVKDGVQGKDLETSDSLSLRIPQKNIIADSNLSELKQHIDNRYNTYKEVGKMADFLVRELKEKYELEVDFDAESGIFLLPNGTFTKDPKGGWVATFLGNAARLLEKLTGITGEDPETSFRIAIEDYLNNSAPKDLSK